MRRANTEAMVRYRPGPFEGSATLVLSSRRAVDMCNPLSIWRRLIRGGVKVEKLPLAHYQMLQADHVQIVADRLSAELDASDGARRL